MTRHTLAGAQGGAVSHGDPQAALDRLAALTAAVEPTVGLSIDQARQELYDALEDMKGAYQQQPDQVIRLCSGHSARVREIAIRIAAVEDRLPHWKQVRTREVEPVLAEIRQQFDQASRLLTQLQFDYTVETGRGALT